MVNLLSHCFPFPRNLQKSWLQEVMLTIWVINVVDGQLLGKGLLVVILHPVSQQI
jgi:hypothetical protein